MTAAAALREGLRRTGRAPSLVIGTFLFTLLVALPLSIALRGMLAGFLDASTVALAPPTGVDYTWWQEFLAQATGLGTTFVPSIAGFGGVLLNLSDLLDNVRLATTVAGAVGAWLLIWSFLSGGILDRLARDRATRAAGFFGACGAHVGAILRLGLIALVVYGAAFRWLQPLLMTRIYGSLTIDATVERSAFLMRVLVYALFGLVLIGLNLVFDYARIRLVVEDRRSAIGSLLAGFRFVRRQMGAVCALYALNALLFVGLAGVYGLVVGSGTAAGAAGWLTIAAGEIYILGRHFLKLTFYASETALFQSRLAHAGYTAAPPVVWPESPAAESIGNAPPGHRS
jgi:hypothetical protein